MTGADDRILEFFEEHQIAMPPSVLTYNIDYSKVHINNRMRRLADKDLLEKVDEVRGFYEITEKGVAYLLGEVSASELEDDE